MEQSGNEKVVLVGDGGGGGGGMSAVLGLCCTGLEVMFLAGVGLT